MKMEGYLLTIDIEKSFDSVDHYFFLAVLEKHGFDKNFFFCIYNCNLHVKHKWTKNRHLLGIKILRGCLGLNQKLLNITSITIKQNKTIANKK